MPFSHAACRLCAGAAFFCSAMLLTAAETPKAPADPLVAAARGGDCEAMLKLADQYFFGRERSENRTLAAYWFRRAAALGDHRAQYNLALCFENGWGVTRSPEVAFHFFAAAATLPEAGTRYAEKLFHGVRACKHEDQEYPAVSADPERAVQLLRKLALHYPRAQLALAKLLFRDAPHHGSELRALLQRHAEEKAPFPEALVLYAACLRSGIGGPTDSALGAKQLERAAATGYPEAVAQLAEILDIGSGLPQDRERALELTKQAAVKGSQRAQVALGDRYLAGDGVDMDLERALQLFEAAAVSGYPPALRRIGDCYAIGLAVEKNEEKAVRYYQEASAGGDDDAQYRLGVCYLKGKGVKADPAAAFFWFDRSAAGGDAQGMREAGISLLEGRGVRRDQERGTQLIQAAAQAGDPVARRMIVTQ